MPLFIRLFTHGLIILGIHPGHYFGGTLTVCHSFIKCQGYAKETPRKKTAGMDLSLKDLTNKIDLPQKDRIIPMQ